MARRLLALPLVCAAVAVFALPRASAFDETWFVVASGSTGGISGLAPQGGSGWVIVRDNKLDGQNRIALLSDAGIVTPLSWPGEQPVDLEALAAVPATSGQYVALTSTGHGYVLALGGTSVAVLRTFAVPRGTANIESFAMTTSGDQTLAVWATRGSTTTPARVFAATFTPATAQFGAVASARVSVPYPTVSVRHVADLVIVSGRLIGSATSDPGASGPFASALYDLGSVAFAGGRARLTIQAPSPLGRFDGHKVEGLACSGALGLLGSDDEKQGASVRTASFCSTG